MLLSHPDLVDVAVIGIDAGNEEIGEFVRAFVVVVVRRRPSDNLVVVVVTEDQLKTWVQERLLARYKWITADVVFLDRIPRAASGKVLKMELRERVKREGVLGDGKRRRRNRWERSSL